MCRIYAVVMTQEESRQFLNSFREIGNELTLHHFNLIAVNGDFARFSLPSFSIYFFSFANRAVAAARITRKFVITVAVDYSMQVHSMFARLRF